MDHVISDNFLDRESFESIKEVVMGSNTIPWFLSWGVSSENAEVQAVANAVWTDDVKAAWKDFQDSQAI